VIEVEETTLKLVAATAPKSTLVAPVKLVPVIVTVVLAPMRVEQQLWLFLRIHRPSWMRRAIHVAIQAPPSFKFPSVLARILSMVQIHQNWISYLVSCEERWCSNSHAYLKTRISVFRF